MCSIGKGSALTFIINIREAISFYSTVCLKSIWCSFSLVCPSAGRGISIFMISLLKQTSRHLWESDLQPLRSHATVEVWSFWAALASRVPKSHGMISEHNSRRGSVSTNSQILAHYGLTYFKTWSRRQARCLTYYPQVQWLTRLLVSLMGRHFSLPVKGLKPQFLKCQAFS